MQIFQSQISSNVGINLLLEEPPLGEITDYFWRQEYHARGAPHIHLLLWVKDAPKFGKDSDESVLSFIQQYIRCAIPKEGRRENFKTSASFSVSQMWQILLMSIPSKGKILHKMSVWFPKAFYFKRKF